MNTLIIMMANSYDLICARCYVKAYRLLVISILKTPKLRLSKLKIIAPLSGKVYVQLDFVGPF